MGLWTIFLSYQKIESILMSLHGPQVNPTVPGHRFRDDSKLDARRVRPAFSGIEPRRQPDLRSAPPSGRAPVKSKEGKRDKRKKSSG